MSDVRSHHDQTPGANEVEMRVKGYRPVTLWLPDTSAPGFAEECRRQYELVKNSASEQEFVNEWWPDEDVEYF